MDLHENDKTERLRSVLKRMERSIDDARTRRTRGSSTGAPSPAGDHTIGSRTPSPNGFDPLDTPIADSEVKKDAAPTQSRTVRDEGSMFDFNGPRLKARAKRRSAS